MEKQYVKLLNDRRVRLAYYPKITVDFRKQTGTFMAAFTNELRKGKFPIQEMLSFAWLMAIEGEKLDGKELGLDKKEFGGLLDIPTFSQIYKIIRSPWRVKKL